jgi:hypothetical protein
MATESSGIAPEQVPISVGGPAGAAVGISC